jgi:protease PrsW
LAQTRDEEQRLLAALTAYRKVFAGRDPQAPRAVWDGRRYHVTFPDGSVRTLDPPEQPVVPLPVILVAPPRPAGGWLGPPQPGHPYR